MNNPLVTIIVVPRERYQFARESLESLYENTTFLFDLVYVDNNSPAKLRRYLEIQAEVKGFKLISSDRYLSPNQARNLGLAHVSSKYVLFVDNDVIFAPNWLTPLIGCAEATEATVVGSLVCQYQPFHEIVHCAGGEYMSAKEYAEFTQGLPHPGDCEASRRHRSKWRIEEKTPYQNQRIEEVSDRLKREPTSFVEFHSMLVRTEIFEEIGMLDERFCCTKEYIDFCMNVTSAGGTIYLEPDSIVTFRTHPPAPALNWSDLPYFMLRWSDAWERDNLQHFQQKWNLDDSAYFQRRYKNLGKRRREALIDPLIAKLSFIGKPRQKWLKKRLIKLEKRLNHYLTNRHSSSDRLEAHTNNVNSNHRPLTVQTRHALSLTNNNQPRKENNNAI